jgi:hypothetical protein
MPDYVIDRLVHRLNELMAYGGLFISVILKTRAKPARRMANYEVEGVMSRNYERDERRERRVKGALSFLLRRKKKNG